jgi:dTDP-4-dehydrorhamnose 3,5-epimerase
MPDRELVIRPTTLLPDVLEIEPKLREDARGFFLESYNEREYRAKGLDQRFVQDNHSRSVGGTLRGLHAQLRHPQGKLLRVVEGEIWDVAVDARPESPTYRKWVGVVLSAANQRQLWVPPRFAHGFCVLSDWAQVEYKVTDFWHPGDEVTIAWDDPNLAIAWPLQGPPVLSTKDAAGKRLAELESQLFRTTGTPA